MTESATLRDLAGSPFDLLREMERRGMRAAAKNLDQRDHEWEGLAFRLGDQVFVAAREDVREVLLYPDQITRIPGSKSWVVGLANVRGQLLPVIDLKAFLGGPVTRPGRETRIIAVNHRDVPAGLVIDEVLGFRRFPGDQRGQNMPEMALRCERYLRGSFRQDAETWPVFDLAGLVQSAQFLKAGRQSA